MTYLGLMERAKEIDQATWTPSDKEEGAPRADMILLRRPGDRAEHEDRDIPSDRPIHSQGRDEDREFTKII